MMTPQFPQTPQPKTLPQARPETLHLGRSDTLPWGSPQVRSENLPLGQVTHHALGRVRDPALRAGQIYPILHIVSVQVKYLTPKHCTSSGYAKDPAFRSGRDPTILLFSMDIHTTKINNLFMCLLNINVVLLNNNLG